MAKYIEVRNAKEFEQMIKDKDLSISKGIVEGILKKPYWKKKKCSCFRNLYKR